MFRNNGYKIGTFFQIPVFIHSTWIFAFALFSFSFTEAFAQELKVAWPQAAAVGIMTALIAFISLLAHEFGHSLTARCFGIGTERITLFILGGVAQIKDEPRKPSHEFMIAIAGPGTSYICMALFAIPYFLLKNAGVGGLLFQESLYTLMIINFAFGTFNLIPGFPMDGGRILRALIWGVSKNFLLATRVASLGGQMFGWFLICVGGTLLFTGNVFNAIMPILLGFFLNKLAKSAYQQSRFKVAFDRLAVRDLMRPIQVVVPADLSLRHVIDHYVYKIHSDQFPVVRGESLLGYITSDDIAMVQRDMWDTLSAGKLAKPFKATEILFPTQNALAAFQKLSALGKHNLPVFQGKKLIGYLFAKDVVGYLQQINGRK